jgi:glycosyltransferase involved in cell wall biosynthesis
MVVESVIREASGGASDVLLVHDYLLVLRGAERTFAAMTECFPQAPLATLLYDRRGTQGRFGHRQVRTSFLQPFAADQRRFRRYLPLLPLAAESLPVKDARVVISSSSAFAHGVRPAEGAVHISYCHSPFRYVWHERERTERGVPAPARPVGHAMLGALRRWDFRAAGRVDGFVANSELTRQRIADFYSREAVVVHPPVDVDRFTARPDPRDYLLTVGEVTRHKNSEIAIAAAERAGMKIKVVGTGPDLSRLRKRFGRAEFLGRVDDRQLAALYAGCQALVVPAIEEFGITMVEAHAAGRPVVAAAGGGALEIVVDGVNGVLVPPRSVNALAEALRATDWNSFDPVSLRCSAQRFSAQGFRRRFVAAVTATLARAPDAPDAVMPVAPRRRPSYGEAARAAAGLALASTPGGSIARSRHRP